MIPWVCSTESGEWRVGHWHQVHQTQNKRKPSVIKTNNVYVTLKENKSLQTLEPKIPLSAFVNKVVFEPGLRLG